MTALSLAGLSKNFGALQALSGIELSVSKGEFLCLVGPTNAGKSTLLKTIAGLHRPDEGRVIINGQEVTELQPGDCGMSASFFKPWHCFQTEADLIILLFRCARLKFERKKLKNVFVRSLNSFESVTCLTVSLEPTPEESVSE